MADNENTVETDWPQYDEPLKPGEHRFTPDGREVWMDEKKAVWVKVNGETFPLGLEPDPNMSPEEYAKAARKEAKNIVFMRIALIALVIMIVVVIALILTK